MPSEIFGWFNGSPSILCILVSKFNLRNERSIVAVNSLCEIVSHCRTPLSCRLSCSILNALSTCCLFKCISAVPYIDLFIPSVKLILHHYPKLICEHGCVCS